MTPPIGTSGLVLNEPLLWEQGMEGRRAFSLPRRDVPPSRLPEDLLGPGPEFPDLSEPEVVRHFTRLSQWNFGVDAGMYPLGSCTMKYNPKINEVLAQAPGLADTHPLTPFPLAQGALRILCELEEMLARVTGMDGVTLQPAAGAQGELTGMLVLHACHRHRGSPRRKILVPDTAHGTNPASAALCGFEIVPLRSGDRGILTPASVAQTMDEETAGIMVTNPNTLGLFEEHIVEIAAIVHEKGGFVYCDGANMNALMGIVHMGRMGVDLLHLNLHKTFGTPHGGGGPGAGPLCVTRALEPFLPVPRVVRTETGDLTLSEAFPLSIGRMHAFYGNFGVLLKAYAYILTMGEDGLREASERAVLHANYVKERLKGVYHLPYDRPCMHEVVFSDAFQKARHITTLDIAKRLMDYGFHPPTIYFPLVVPGALMIEPTETETRESLDALVEALLAIDGEATTEPDLLHEAPHVCKVRRLDETTAARRPCLVG